jgi:hypothetical protein
MADGIAKKRDPKKWAAAKAKAKARMGGKHSARAIGAPSQARIQLKAKTLQVNAICLRKNEMQCQIKNTRGLQIKNVVILQKVNSGVSSQTNEHL